MVNLKTKTTLKNTAQISMSSEIQESLFTQQRPISKADVRFLKGLLLGARGRPSRGLVGRVPIPRARRARGSRVPRLAPGPRGPPRRGCGRLGDFSPPDSGPSRSSLGPLLRLALSPAPGVSFQSSLSLPGLRFYYSA